VTRMTRRLLAGAIVVLIPALAGCEAGANAPTSEFHPAAYGAYHTPTAGAGGITISNAFILGAPVNQSLPAGGDASLFVSFYSTSGDQLEKISVSNAKSVQITGGSVNLPVGSSVNLTGPNPEIVLTDLSAPLASGGDVSVTFDFANAGPISLQVPVQPQAYAYSTYAQPPSPAPSPTATATATATSTATGTATASPTTTASTTAVHHKKEHHASAKATSTPSPTPSVTP
jgi:copper(I)-binding protein